MTRWTRFLSPSKPARETGDRRADGRTAAERELDRESWHPQVIAGRAIILRPHRPEHFETVSRWYRDPELARLTRFHVGPVTDEEVRAYFNARLVSPDSFAYAIHRATDEALIGTTTFSQLDPDNRSVMFHITIGEPEAWGHGYGTEATRLMVGHAFTRLGVHRVGLSVFAFNERAIRSYEKAGFIIEGRAREAVWRDGRFWDEIHMGILDQDWRAQQKEPGP
jgi:RimJ/RimL family protein N-acetyltransferase